MASGVTCVCAGVRRMPEMYRVRVRGVIGLAQMLGSQRVLIAAISASTSGLVTEDAADPNGVLHRCVSVVKELIEVHICT